MTDIIVSQEKLKKLLDIEHRFYSFKHKLTNMSPEVNTEFDSLSNAVHELFKEHNDKEEKEQERKMLMFEAANDEHEFESIWSIYEIDSLNDKFGYVGAVMYHGVIEDVDKEVTYLDLWFIAERLIKESGDYHHLFIEAFQKINEDDFFELQTGS